MRDSQFLLKGCRECSEPHPVDGSVGAEDLTSRERAAWGPGCRRAKNGPQRTGTDGPTLRTNCARDSPDAADRTTERLIRETVFENLSFTFTYSWTSVNGDNVSLLSSDLLYSAQHYWWDASLRLPSSPLMAERHSTVCSWHHVLITLLLMEVWVVSSLGL